jgi:hypothetical protein
MAAISNAIVNNQETRPEGTTLTQTIDGFALSATDGNARATEFNNTAAAIETEQQCKARLLARLMQ